MTSDDLLFRLLRGSSTMRHVQSFLREHGFSYSAASWDALIDLRLKPALQNGLTSEMLVGLLREAEEYGHQHVFLFLRRVRRGHFPTDTETRRWLAGTPDEELLSGPRLLEYPDEPTLAEVRRDAGFAITLKTVETRSIVELVSERDQPNGHFVREYRRTPERAVNIVRIHEDGLLEIRIYSHSATGGKYRDDLPLMWGLLSGLVDEHDYGEYSLERAKQSIWEQRRQLKGALRFSKALLRDKFGTTMDCATGRLEADLFDDAAADEGLTVFHKRGDAYCDRHNLWWLSQHNGVPSTDVHVLLSGAPNEFAVTMQCVRNDYEHVLAELRRLNQ